MIIFFKIKKMLFLFVILVASIDIDDTPECGIDYDENTQEVSLQCTNTSFAC